MFFNKLNQRLSKIEEKQSQILNELSEVKELTKDNNYFLTKYVGSYSDKKMRSLRNTMLGGDFNSKQLDTLSEIVSMFKGILKDKESLEKELELLRGDNNGQL